MIAQTLHFVCTPSRETIKGQLGFYRVDGHLVGDTRVHHTQGLKSKTALADCRKTYSPQLNASIDYFNQMKPFNRRLPTTDKNNSQFLAKLSNEGHIYIKHRTPSPPTTNVSLLIRGSK